MDRSVSPTPRTPLAVGIALFVPFAGVGRVAFTGHDHFAAATAIPNRIEALDFGLVSARLAFVMVANLVFRRAVIISAHGYFLLLFQELGTVPSQHFTAVEEGGTSRPKYLEASIISMSAAISHRGEADIDPRAALARESRAASSIWARLKTWGS
jgi:hypothetical protein